MQEKYHKARIPFPRPPPDSSAKYQIGFLKPSSINVVGSYARKTAIQTGDCLEIDLAISMPLVVDFGNILLISLMLLGRLFFRTKTILTIVTSTKEPIT